MATKIDWVAVEADYRETRRSIREIARSRGLSDGAIRKKAKAEGWTRPDMKKVRGAHREVKAAAAALAAPATEPEDLIERGRDIIGRLMDELSGVTSNIGEIEDMILAETENDENDKRRQAMFKAVSLSSRSGVARNLASALKTIEEAGVGGGKVGKKEQQAAAAQEIAASGRFAPRRAPKLVVDNGR
jgi:hypothetical protein